MKTFAFRLALMFALIGAPVDAHAHLVDTRLGDFYGGMLHPLTGLDNALPWLALAILAAFQGAQHARWLLVVFPISLFAGAALSLVVPMLPFLPTLSVASIAIIGLSVAAGVVMPLSLLICLGTVVGLLHGYQNGQAMTDSTDHLLFISGVTAIGYASVTLATGLAISFLRGGAGWRMIALRASGSWIAAVGIMALGLQFFALTAM
jgi:urease accessory protein